MSENKNYGESKKPSRYAGKCDIRLSQEENSMLDRLASDNGVTRSDVMRRALKDYFVWNTGEKKE